VKALKPSKCGALATDPIVFSRDLISGVLELSSVIVRLHPLKYSEVYTTGGNMRKGKRKHCMSQSKVWDSCARVRQISVVFRWKSSHLTGSWLQMLATLASLKLTGVLLKRNNVRLHAEPEVLEKLQICGLGTRGSKRRAKARKEQEGATPEVPTFIDITLEEAYFLQNSLRCLQVRVKCCTVSVQHNIPSLSDYWGSVCECSQCWPAQVIPDEPTIEEQSKAQVETEVEPKALCTSLPVRVRHHGLHAGIVSRPGIHGLEERLMYEIDAAEKQSQLPNLPSEAEEDVRTPLTSEELWKKCAAKVPDWSYWYTTYHHFRSKVT
jgi:hypothetical protein